MVQLAFKELLVHKELQAREQRGLLALQERMVQQAAQAHRVQQAYKEAQGLELQELLGQLVSVVLLAQLAPLELQALAAVELLVLVETQFSGTTDRLLITRIPYHQQRTLEVSDLSQ
jgi:hypothetical protein